MNAFRILAAIAVLGWGCDLPPIPSFDPPDVDVDAGVQTDVRLPGPVCEPNRTSCVGNAVAACAPDGHDFTVEPCATGQACADGQCIAIRNSCDEGQRFALSRRSLSFDVTSDFKSQTKEVRLTNCDLSPLLIRDAIVRGPERPDGTPVFALSTEFAQVFVAPGQWIDLKVAYRPAAGLSHVEGKLELSLLLDELTNVELALRSKALCGSATPVLDLGVRDEGSPARASGLLQNCGTEPLTLTDVTTGPHISVHLERSLPLVLAAKEEIEFEVAVAPDAPRGPIVDAAEFRLTEHAPLHTSVRAFVRHPECVELTPATPQILVNNVPATPRPGGLVRIRFPTEQPGVTHRVSLREQPEGSFEVPTRVSDGWAMRPRIVGAYDLAIVAFDAATARISCKTATTTLQVTPVAPLFFELSWSATDDGIPDDLGFGHGPNLDLHVLSSHDQSGQWNDPAWDCYPGVTGRCGAADGSISVSQASGLPEYVAFPSPADFEFEVGVYLSNPFNFRFVEARLRVYANGVLVAELRSDKLQGANDFWLAGIFDGKTGQWASIDSTFSGFPR